MRIGMMIDSGREYSSLYYLDDDTLHFDLTVISSDTLLQWHQR